MLVVAGATQACGDSTKKTATHQTAAGAGGALDEAGAAASGAGGNDPNGSARAGAAPKSEGGATATAGVSAAAGTPSSHPDGGATETGGASGVGACHISWSGAETGEAGCPRLHVCHKNFLSLNLGDPDPPTPLKSIQLVYSPDHDLSLGTSMATGLDAVNSNVQTPDGGATYRPELDQNSMLTGGTSMTVVLTALSFSTDPNDPCAGTAHGSLDAVLAPADAQAGAESLSLHAEF